MDLLLRAGFSFDTPVAEAARNVARQQRFYCLDVCSELLAASRVPPLDEPCVLLVRIGDARVWLVPDRGRHYRLRCRALGVRYSPAGLGRLAGDFHSGDLHSLPMVQFVFQHQALAAIGLGKRKDVAGRV